jgi:hypothetical protein
MFNPINIFLQLVQWFIGHLFIGLFQSSGFSTIAIALVESHSIGYAERSRSVSKVSVFSVFPWQKKVNCLSVICVVQSSGFVANGGGII